MKKLLLLLCFLAGAGQAGAQILNITESPVYTLPCDSGCATLHAEHLVTRKTNTYVAAEIPFAPLAAPGATAIPLTDDHFSTAIPIGFSFCFYEQVFTNAYISDNGHITFNSLYSGQSASFDTKTALPFYNSTFPDNAIFGPFMDNKPTGGATVKYATLGTAPLRKFVVTWSGMPLFGSTCGGGTSTYQVILYETTNRIECHITNKITCDADAANYRNYATLGIQSAGASAYNAVTGRNASVWTASNEGWAFTPNGVLTSTLDWLPFGGGAPLASWGDSIRRCFTSYPYQLIARLTLSCPYAVYYDTLTINKNLPKIDSLGIIKPLCNTSGDGIITVYASGAVPPYTYALNGPPFVTTNVFTGVNAGPVMISVKDANGCRYDTVFLLEPVSKVLIAIDTVLAAHCPLEDGGAVVHVDSGVGPFTYLWSNDDADSVLNNVEGDIFYSVTVTDALGCTGTTNVYVPDSGKPKIIASVGASLCGKPTGKITTTVSLGLPPYTYAWSPSVSTGPSATGLYPGTYVLTVTDANGCFKVLPIHVLDSMNITTYLDTTHTTCGLANGSAQTTIYSAPDTPYTFLWSDGQTTNPAVGLAGGQYYSVLITSGNGCTHTDSFYVNPSPALVVNMQPANANCDSANGAINTTLTNPTGPVTYLWSTGSTDTYISGLEPGIFWVKVVDSLGCVDSNSVTLGDDGRPHLQILTYNPPACFGDSTGSISLSGSNGVSPYKYSLDGETFSTDAFIDHISGGTYTIYIRDANSCPNDTTVTFSQPPQIVISALPSDTLVCYADTTGSLSVWATGGFPPYEFALDGGGFSTETSYTGLGGGTHAVQARDTNNCIVKQEFTVPGPPAPLTVKLNKSDVPCFQTTTGAASAIASGGWSPYAFAWSNGETGSQLNSLTAGTYSLTITDNRGCTVSAGVEVIQNLCCKAVVANGFTPNGDGRNDILNVREISEVSELDFKIFNRFGQVVYQTGSLDGGWDGTFNGQPADVGVYYYWLTYKCPFSTERYTLKGDVTLIR